jgi:hypothetical protein
LELLADQFQVSEGQLLATAIVTRDDARNAVSELFRHKLAHDIVKFFCCKRVLDEDLGETTP